MSQPLIMSFRPDAAAMCLDGRKTMTRRICKPEHVTFVNGVGRMMGVASQIRPHTGPFLDSDPVLTRPQYRSLWEVGKPITIKASRTGKGLGKVMCTGLRVEHVQDITEEDARREGMEERCHDGPIGGQWAIGPIGNFYNTWKRLYPTGPKSWDANPLVVVIEFKPMEVQG